MDVLYMQTSIACLYVMGAGASSVALHEDSSIFTPVKRFFFYLLFNMKSFSSLDSRV